MQSSKKLQKGLVALQVIVMLTFLYVAVNQWNIPQKRAEESMDQVQEERKQLIRQTCEGKGMSKDVSTNMLSHLIVDDKHSVIYCFVPKVACTNLKRFMFILKNGEPYSDPGNVSVDVHRGNWLDLLRKSPQREIKAKLKHYTKFLFVRDPFVRIISAYRDKIVLTYDPYYTLYVKYILRRFAKTPNPPENWKEARRVGTIPSFVNFVQYLVHPRTHKSVLLEPHWREMNQLCHPCSIQYDFIGHQENLQEDIEHLLRTLKLQADIKLPPANVNMTTSDSVEDWFRPVPLEDRRKLYKMYEKDFKLFGYRRPDELLDG